MPQPEDVLDSIGKLTTSLFSHSKRYTNARCFNFFTHMFGHVSFSTRCWWLGDKLACMAV